MGCEIIIPKTNFGLFINGEFVNSVSGRTFKTINRTTGEKIAADFAEGDKDDVDLAVNAARAAFMHGPWSRMSASERGEILIKFVDLVEKHIDELAASDAIHVGNLFRNRYYAAAVERFRQRPSLPMPRHLRPRPFGVLSFIIPWNFPAPILFLENGPSLAATGSTMVLKPSVHSPLSALCCAHLAKLAGFPDGVINVVTGYGPTAGAAISSHFDINHVSFTGSTSAGRLVKVAAYGSNFKSVSVGQVQKPPLVIFDDADVDSAVNLALKGGFTNQGQLCMFKSRIFVQQGIYDKFVTKIARHLKEPFDPSMLQGPKANKAYHEKLLYDIEQGKRQGLTLLTGKKLCGEKGYCIETTEFIGSKDLCLQDDGMPITPDDMLFATGNTFGPVVCVNKFKTIEEAITRATSTHNRLATGVAFTKDSNIANTVSSLALGHIIWINPYMEFDADYPFQRDLGMDELDKFYQYLQVESAVKVTLQFS